MRDPLEMDGKGERDEQGRFLPGWKGGPGRPKFSLVAIIKDKLKEVPEGEDRTWAELFIEEYLKDVYSRKDGVAIRDLIDRFDGKARQHIETDGIAALAFVQLARDLINEPDEEAEGDS